MLTLGIPPNAVMALMVGAMTIHNIQPGPQVMTSNPSLFWGLIASMWIGNLMLVVLNLPLIGIWVQLLKVPYRLLYPAILVFCAIGVYSINNNPFDVTITAVFGLLGYVFYKLRCEPAPLILGFILGPMMEENLRRAMLLSRGDPTVFFTRPLSLGLLIAAAALIVIVALPNIKKKREEAFQEGRTRAQGTQRFFVRCANPLLRWARMLLGRRADTKHAGLRFQAGNTLFEAPNPLRGLNAKPPCLQSGGRTDILYVATRDCAQCERSLSTGWHPNRLQLNIEQLAGASRNRGPGRASQSGHRCQHSN